MRSDLAPISGFSMSDSGLFRPRQPYAGLKRTPSRHALAVLARPRSHLNRLILYAMFAVVMTVLARAQPTVRVVSTIRAFWWAKTCSTFARFFDSCPLAFAVGALIGRLCGFLRWMRLFSPCSLSHFSFFAEWYPQYFTWQVLPGSTRPSRIRLTSFAVVAVTIWRRIIPCIFSMLMWIF